MSDLFKTPLRVPRQTPHPRAPTAIFAPRYYLNVGRSRDLHLKLVIDSTPQGRALVPRPLGTVRLEPSVAPCRKAKG